MIPNISLFMFEVHNILALIIVKIFRATKAASMILNLTSADNGASLTVFDPGILPQ